MKLCKDSSNNITHILDPPYDYYFSFCGLSGRFKINNKLVHKCFNGTPDQVNCGTCKVMAHNYILRKLKGET